MRVALLLVHSLALCTSMSVSQSPSTLSMSSASQPPPTLPGDVRDSRWKCYFLVTRKTSQRPRQRTYIGVTTNLTRRLRQHNKEIRGGAKYTRMVGAMHKRGAAAAAADAAADDAAADVDEAASAIEERPWRVICAVSGFRTQREALQFEWAAKHVPKTRGRGYRSSGGGVAARLARSRVRSPRDPRDGY